ncbi:IQ domain-containing protein K [Eufriesea mexicana]|uniref:IQ domain-containing protein K n=1 Tax=Eufriesea mexicana TaxID=516756 RepID=A0A310SUD9_9HYME|nr:IQ domain-containing protein K [Eufriesea mexicana]
MENIIQKKDDLLPSNYLDNKIFGLLVPALEETLIEASKQNVLRVQKCRFNGLDYIAEILWNRNPRRSKIFLSPLNVFEIPSFKEYLRLHPRPYYPKSWLWSEDEAALYIQRYVRGWLVRKCSDVQEMRQFWKRATKEEVDWSAGGKNSTYQQEGSECLVHGLLRRPAVALRGIPEMGKRNEMQGDGQKEGGSCTQCIHTSQVTMFKTVSASDLESDGPSLLFAGLLAVALAAPSPVPAPTPAPAPAPAPLSNAALITAPLAGPALLSNIGAPLLYSSYPAPLPLASYAPSAPYIYKSYVY